MFLSVYSGLICSILNIFIYVVLKEDTALGDYQQKFSYKEGTHTLEAETCENLRIVPSCQHGEGKSNNTGQIPMKCCQ